MGTKKKGIDHKEASGVLRNNRFEHTDEETQLMYEYNIVSNVEEESFSYTSQNDGSQWLLYHNGQLKDTTSGQEIARADTCYGYNTEGGLSEMGTTHM